MGSLCIWGSRDRAARAIGSAFERVRAMLRRNRQVASHAAKNGCVAIATSPGAGANGEATCRVGGRRSAHDRGGACRGAMGSLFREGKPALGFKPIGKAK